MELNWNGRAVEGSCRINQSLLRRSRFLPSDPETPGMSVELIGEVQRTQLPHSRTPSATLTDFNCPQPLPLTLDHIRHKIRKYRAPQRLEPGL